MTYTKIDPSWINNLQPAHPCHLTKTCHFLAQIRDNVSIIRREFIPLSGRVPIWIKVKKDQPAAVDTEMSTIATRPSEPIKLSCVIKEPDQLPLVVRTRHKKQDVRRTQGFQEQFKEWKMRRESIIK